MSTDPIFTDLLSTDLGNVKAPPVLPQGTYYGTIKDYKLDKSKEKQTPYVRISINNITPSPTVPAEALSEIDLSKEVLERDYFLLDKNGQKNLFYIKEFLSSINLPVGEGSDIGTNLPKMAGSPVLVEIGHRNSPDGKRVFADIKDVKGRQ